MKKVISILTTLVFVLMLMPVNAFAEDTPSVIEVSDNEAFHNAFSDAEDGDTIKVCADFEVNGSTIFINKNITLDMNGHTIMIYNISSLFIVGERNDNASFTIKDNSEGNGKITSGYSRLISNNGSGEINITDVTLETGEVSVLNYGTGRINIGEKAKLICNGDNREYCPLNIQQVPKHGDKKILSINDSATLENTNSDILIKIEDKSVNKDNLNQYADLPSELSSKIFFGCFCADSFTKLNDLIQNANDGDVFYITQYINLNNNYQHSEDYNQSIIIYNDITIDLMDSNFIDSNMTCPLFIIGNYAHVTIQNGLSIKNQGIVFINYGTLTIQNVNLACSGDDYIIENNKILNMNDTNVYSYNSNHEIYSDDGTVTLSGNSFLQKIFLKNQSKLNIKNFNPENTYAFYNGDNKVSFDNDGNYFNPDGIENEFDLLEASTVTFDSNSGGNNENVVVGENKMVDEPSAPAREGYTFDGWYNGQTKYDFSTPVTENITLKAKWIQASVPTPDPTSAPIPVPTPDTIEEIRKSVNNDLKEDVKVFKGANNDFSSFDISIDMSKLTDEQLKALKDMSDDELTAELDKIKSTIMSINKTEINKTALEEIILQYKDAKIMAINFRKHAEFKSPVTVAIQVDKNTFPAGTYKLYFYNEETGEFEDCGDVVVDKDGNATFTLAHCSDYFISDKDLTALNTTVSSENTSHDTNPKTGSTLPLQLIIVSGLATIALIATSEKRK